MIDFLSYLAIVVLACSHWLQIWKIHVHREVRDISVWTYALLFCGYSMLFTKAIVDYMASTGDVLWVLKQIATIIPVTVVIFQIYWHRKDKWHDEYDLYCSGCKGELEDDWGFCPYCGDPKHPKFIPKTK